MKILQYSSSDISGGAERVAWDLFRSYRNKGHESYLAVSTKKSQDADVICVPHEQLRSRWARFWSAVACPLNQWVGTIRGPRALKRTLEMRIGQPKRYQRILRGYEDFDFPGTQLLPMLAPVPPDLIHGHNLHGGGFDLRTLPEFSQRQPFVLTLHDAWLLSGHCAHSFECERWKLGCGQCPDLTIYPSIPRDNTAENWRIKEEILSRSRISIATPSQWLMDRIHQSPFNKHFVSTRVIPNGVDLSVFKPGDRKADRKLLGIDPSAKVLLFAANSLRENPWKDFRTLKEAVLRIGRASPDEQVLFLGIGDGGPKEHLEGVEIRFIPYQKDPATLARYYRAADLYIHAARAETFGLVLCESLACGTPVVATAVGGIPEIIQQGSKSTGALTPAGDPEAMAKACLALLRNSEVYENMSHNAVEDARARFGLDLQAERYLSWYQEILSQWNTR